MQIYSVYAEAPAIIFFFFFMRPQFLFLLEEMKKKFSLFRWDLRAVLPAATRTSATHNKILKFSLAYMCDSCVYMYINIYIYKKVWAHTFLSARDMIVYICICVMCLQSRLKDTRPV